MTSPDIELVPCGICHAQVETTQMAAHRDWHEQLVDDVVSAVKVRLEDRSAS